MSSEILRRAAEESFFRPRQRFAQLAEDHVPFDLLTGKTSYEGRTLRECVDREGVVGIVGPRGGGKSSLIAHACKALPDSHLALRVPVSGADDPTSVSVVCAVTLSQALNDIDMAKQQRRGLSRFRADSKSSERSLGAGGTLGGGPIPAALHTDLGTLRKQVQTNALAVDRLAGIDRLISILIARGRRPVFVLEDTEAAIGGEDATTAKGFIDGPIRAFVHEIDAACLIAIQDVFQPLEAFEHLSQSMAMIEIPNLQATAARAALEAIVENRLGQFDLGKASAADVLSEAAIDRLVGFYVETSGNLRATLAALQSAAEYAAEQGAEAIGDGQMRAGVEDWHAQSSR
jgi:energy-coupling factor transporter ATP-binding protein EcfA2